MIKYEEEEVLLLLRDMTQQVAEERKLKKEQELLEKLVKERTSSLIEANKKLGLEIKKQKKYELQIQKSLEKEKELNELKSRFISMASHEYRTPLTSIKIFADLLKMHGRKIENDKYYSYISKINNSVEYMTELINDVLMVNKAETGKIKLNPVVLDFNKLCNSIYEEYRDQSESKHEIILNYISPISLIYADEKLLRQVISNLISNAIKYSPGKGRIDFSVNTNGEKIIVIIKDEGIGILPEDRDKIFSSFYRGQNIGTVPGTGLGLYIVKRIVELCGGSIYFESIVNQGTAFTVELPLTKAKKIKNV